VYEKLGIQRLGDTWVFPLSESLEASEPYKGAERTSASFEIASESARNFGHIGFYRRGLAGNTVDQFNPGFRTQMLAGGHSLWEEYILSFKGCFFHLWIPPSVNPSIRCDYKTTLVRLPFVRLGVCFAPSHSVRKCLVFSSTPSLMPLTFRWQFGVLRKSKRRKARRSLGLPESGCASYRTGDKRWKQKGGKIQPSNFTVYFLTPRRMLIPLCVWVAWTRYPPFAASSSTCHRSWL